VISYNTLSLINNNMLYVVMNEVGAVRADNAVINQLTVFADNFHAGGANYSEMLGQLWDWVLSISESIFILI